MSAHGVGGAVGKRSGDDGAGGIGLAPRLDDLGGACQLRSGLDNCTTEGDGRVSAIPRKEERQEKGCEAAVPLTRPRMSVVRARSGGQPGLSTAVVRGILRFG